MDGALVVGVSGSPSDPSRTSTLVAATVARLAEDLPDARTAQVEIGPLLADLGAAPSREAMSAETRRALETVEAADVLVVGSPAFRAAASPPVGAGTVVTVRPAISVRPSPSAPAETTTTSRATPRWARTERMVSPASPSVQSTTVTDCNA